jgi:hypothetical protein
MIIMKWQTNWARLTSDICSPPVIWALLIFPIAFRYATSGGPAIFCALVYLILVCLLPALYIVWMVRRGYITDIHMQFRHERLRPFIVSIFCTAATWAILRLSGAPDVMPLMAAIMLAQLIVMTVITLVWQISMHAMSITGAVVAVGLVFGLLPALLVSPLVPLVGAARLRLNRHTPAQVVAGTLVGGLVTIALLVIF